MLQNSIVGSWSLPTLKQIKIQFTIILMIRTLSILLMYCHRVANINNNCVFFVNEQSDHIAISLSYYSAAVLLCSGNTRLWLWRTNLLSDCFTTVWHCSLDNLATLNLVVDIVTNSITEVSAYFVELSAYKYIFILRGSVIKNSQGMSILHHYLVTGRLFLIEIMVISRNIAAGNISEVRSIQ